MVIPTTKKDQQSGFADGCGLLILGGVAGSLSLPPPGDVYGVDDDPLREPQVLVAHVVAQQVEVLRAGDGGRDGGTEGGGRQGGEVAEARGAVGAICRGGVEVVGLP